MNKMVVILLLLGLLGSGSYWMIQKSKSLEVKAETSSNAKTVTKKVRLIGLNGTITETLFALGVGPALVGRDTSSYYPKEALKLPTVGYQHRLNAEGILRLKPTMVVGLQDVKPLSVLKQIKSAGVDVLLMKQPNDIASCKAMIRKLGKVLNREAKAKSLLAAMEVQLAKLASLQKAWKGAAPRTVALYVRGNRHRFVLGRKTTVGGMLSLVGAKPAIDFAKVKPISAEAMVAARPEVIVAFSKGVASIGGLDKLASLPGVPLTPAGKHKRFVVMDDLFLGGFGPRAAHAAVMLFRGIFKQVPSPVADKKNE